MAGLALSSAVIREGRIKCPLHSQPKINTTSSHNSIVKKTPQNHKCNSRKQENIFKILGVGRDFQNKIQNPGATMGPRGVCDSTNTTTFCEETDVGDKVLGEHTGTEHSGHTHHT